jgi:hypothetical protein
MKKLLLILIIPMLSFGQDLSISPGRKAFYAGEDFKVLIKGISGEKVSFDFDYANRTIARGDFKFDAKGECHLKLNFPKIKPAISVAAKLICETKQGKTTEVLYFFPRQAFSSDSFKISLWHSDGQLKSILNKSGAKVVSVGDLARFQGEVLLVDQMNFKAFPGIENSIRDLCKKDITIVFTNSKGNLPLPEGVKKLCLESSAFIKKINKRFDELTNSKGVMVSLKNRQSVLKFTEEKTALSYCSMKIGRGEIIFISGIVQKEIKENPSSLYLIKSIIKEGERI